MVYFVGAGSGAPDLITVRGARLLNQADQIIYAGSLVNPELLDYKKESAVVYDSAKMTLEEVVEKIQEAESTGKMTVRLHTGDPCVYGAIREQMDELDKLNISYKVCPLKPESNLIFFLFSRETGRDCKGRRRKSRSVDL